LNEYLENNKEKHENKVFYVTDIVQQAQYIKMFKENNMEAVILNTKLDNPYMSTIEMNNQGISFVRIDADLADTLKDTSKEENKELNESLENLFKENLEKGDNLKIKVESLKATEISGVIQLGEQARRMEEMAKIYGMAMPFGAMPPDETLILNANNNVVNLLFKFKDDESKKEETKMICKQIYDLATMSHKHLDMNSMTSFIERSNKILEMLLNN
ncbi:MAG: molecular chaperone HtpG, partial [Eubacteriales bacterium]|nr:molecular chaperone HtpG [Eubacteriales bacterium]